MKDENYSKINWLNMKYEQFIRKIVNVRQWRTKFAPKVELVKEWVAKSQPSFFENLAYFPHVQKITKFLEIWVSYHFRGHSQSALTKRAG